MIHLSHVSKTYGNVTALSDVSIQVETGEIVALLGPNGAGKTTTMKIITGTLEPTTGSISVGGLSYESDRETISDMIGYLPENTPLYPDLTVYEHIDMAASLHKLTGEKKRKAITQALTATDLLERKLYRISALSKGLKQRTALAMALVHTPKILILDEPTTGLDPNQIREIRSMIQSLKKHTAIILSTHIMQEVEALADRVVVLSQGKCVKVSTVEELATGEVSTQVAVLTVRSKKSIVSPILSPLVDRFQVQQIGDMCTIVAESSSDMRPQLVKALVAENIDVLEVQQQKQSLETVFASLTA